MLAPASCAAADKGYFFAYLLFAAAAGRVSHNARWRLASKSVEHFRLALLICRARSVSWSSTAYICLFLLVYGATDVDVRPSSSVSLIVWRGQTIVCRYQTMVCRYQTIVCSGQTITTLTYGMREWDYKLPNIRPFHTKFYACNA